jgi:hypothetical protein
MSVARRFPLQFSVRSLFVVTTVIAAGLAYEVNWIRQRHAFLEDQRRRHAAVWQNLGDDRKRDLLEWWQNQQYSDKRAPGLLWIFGESAVDELYIIIPPEEIATGLREIPEFGTCLVYEISPNHTDYRTARRLFPEARVTVMRWCDGKNASGGFEVQIRQ